MLACQEAVSTDSIVEIDQDEIVAALLNDFCAVVVGVRVLYVTLDNLNEDALNRTIKYLPPPCTNSHTGSFEVLVALVGVHTLTKRQSSDNESEADP